MVSPFMQNPLDVASREIATDAMARSEQALGAVRPRPAQAPQAPEIDTPKAYFENMAAETGLPPNVLWAASEMSDEPEQAIRSLQVETERAGGDVKTAVRAVFGDSARDVLTRGFDIAANEFPRAEEDQPGVVGDLTRSVVGGVQQGIGMVAEGAGRLFQDVDEFELFQRATGFEVPEALEEHAEYAAAPIEAVRAVRGLIGQGLERIGEYLSDSGESTLRLMSDASRQAMEDSGVSGDIFDPSSLRFNGDPSLRGVAMLSANVLGNLAPVVASALFAGPGAAAAVGGMQGFEGGAQIAEDVTQQAFDEGRLQTESTFYQAQVEAGASPEEALDRTKRAAALAGGALAAAVAAGGGVATGRIAQGAIGTAAGGGAARKIATSTAVGAVEEGAQEALEGVAARQGANLAVDAGSNITEETGGDFFAGALGGGPVGAAGGVASAVRDRQAKNAADIADGQQQRPDAPVPPSPPAPLGAVRPDPAAARPVGPLEAAQARIETPEAAAPPRAPLYPDLKVGDSVLIRNPQTGEVRPVTYLGETPNGVEVRVEGGRREIPSTAFDALRYEGDIPPQDDPAGPTPQANETRASDPNSTEPGPTLAPRLSIDDTREQPVASLPPVDLTGEETVAPAPPPREVDAAVEPVAPPAPPPGAAPTETPGARGDVNASQLVALDGPDLMAVETDAATFQYKAGGDQDGVTDRLQKIRNWHRMAAAGAMVYEYEDGRRAIVDGHQRLGLAKRLAAEGQDVGMDVYLVREADGITPREAMVAAALNNIRQGSGTAIDAARVLRDVDAENDQLDLPPNSPLVRDALAMRPLSSEAWGMVVNEVAPVRNAAAVGSKIKNPDLHVEAMKIMGNAKPASRVEAETIAGQIEMDAEGVEAETVTDLFGDQEVARSHYAERGAVVAAALRRLKKNRALSKTLAARGSEIEEIGNSTVDQEANKENLAQDGAATAYVERQTQTKGPISDALKAAAARFASEGNIGPAVSDFIEAVRKVASGEVPTTAPDGEGSGEVTARAPETEPQRDLTTQATPETATRRPQASTIEQDPFDAALDGVFGPEGESVAPAQTEATPEGEQTLVPGVATITDRDRAEAQMNRPKKGGNAPAPGGRGDLFGDPDDRGDLFDAPQSKPQTESPTAAPATPQKRAAEIRKESERRMLDLGDTPEGGDRGDAFANLTGRVPARLFLALARAEDTPEARRAAADGWVLELGRERGKEHYVIMDDDGYVLEAGAGRVNGLSFSARVQDAAPGTMDYATHNHPASRGLSAMDMSVLSLFNSGIRAIPHEEGQASSVARRVEGKPLKFDKMRDIAGEIERVMARLTSARVTKNNADAAFVDAANAQFHHVANRVMADLDLIVYEGPGIGLDDLAGVPYEEILNAVRKSKAVLDGIRRAGLDVEPDGASSVDQRSGADGAVGDAGRSPAEREGRPGGGGSAGVAPISSDLTAAWGTMSQDGKRELLSEFGLPTVGSLQIENFEPSARRSLARRWKAMDQKKRDDYAKHQGVSAKRNGSMEAEVTPESETATEDALPNGDAARIAAAYPAFLEALTREFSRVETLRWNAYRKTGRMSSSKAKMNTKKIGEPFGINSEPYSLLDSLTGALVLGSMNQQSDPRQYVKKVLDEFLRQEIEGFSPPQTSPSRSSKDIADDIKGILDGMEETGDLFGLDEDDPAFTAPQQPAYSRLRSLFREALSEADLTSMSKQEAFVTMMRPLAEQGLTRDDVKKLRPFFEAHYDAETNQEISDVSSTSSDVESDRGDRPAGDAVGGADVPSSGGSDAEGLGARGGADREGTGDVPETGRDLPEDDAAGSRSASDRGVAGREGDGSGRAGRADANDGVGGRDDRGDGRADDDGRGEGDADPDAGTDADLTDRQATQARADQEPIKNADAANIAATLPLLLPEQRDDVLAVETRFAKPDGHGMLITNGTGTGKTYSGGGIIKRMVQQGKDSILIVAPSDGILDAWMAMGDDVGIPMSRLKSTSDAGTGVVLATYANVGDNTELAKRDWDMVVTDEAHTLMSNADGNSTGALDTIRAITNRPQDIWRRARMLDQKAWDKWKEMPEGEPRDRERDRLQAKADAAQERFKAQDRAKVLFLSATPFAYDNNVDYGEGYLFNYGGNEVTPSGSRQDGRAMFMVRNFGYRIRTHKLTQPEAGVDSGVFEREFHSKLRRDGALIGRSLDIDADYDRRFIQVESREGEKLDRALQSLSETARAAPKAQQSDWMAVEKVVNRHFDYIKRVQLLEAIKAEKAIPAIRAHLDMGRKLVVFHDYNKGGGFNPFRPEGAALTGPQHTLLRRWRDGNPDARSLNFSRLAAPIDALTSAFGARAALYNGRETKRARKAAVERFNEDGSGLDVILVQSDAGAAGISLHDTTGKHQRVLLNIGMPNKPTMTLQQEGRIRRVGSVSDAIFRYMTIGTGWERTAFASKIAGNSATVENLALGPEARTIRENFIAAYMEADTNPAGMEGEGKGGREADARRSTTSQEEGARTHYFGRLKDNRRRSARAGIEHYATPEPVGLAMTQWLDLRPLDRALEPSAGDGAIARYLRGDAERVLIEPDTDLRSRATLVAVGANDIDGTFEDHHVVNKYDGIVMNPPFGRGGKTAMDHVGKALSHVNPGGRVVALIPTGPAADKRFSDLMDGAVWERHGMHLVADVAMPAVTFEKAGTAVATRIVVIERPFDRKAPSPQTKRVNLTGAEKITDLFDGIENVSMPPRPDIPIEEPAAETDTDTRQEVSATGEAGAERANTDAFETFDFPHTKTGQTVYGANMKERVEKDVFKAALAVARKNGGWWSRFKSGDAQPGFLFKTKKGRDAFTAEAAADLGLNEAGPVFPPSRADAIAALQKRLADLGLSARVSLRTAERIVGQGPDGDTIDIEGYQKGTVIGVAMDAADPAATLDHESIHALRDPAVWGRPYGAFTKDEWQALVRAARRDKAGMAQVRADYPDLDAAAQVEEAVARMFSDWRAGKTTSKDVQPLYRKLRKLLSDIYDALTGGSRTAAEKVMADVADGAVGARDPISDMVAEAARGARQSRPKGKGARPNAWLDDLPGKLDTGRKKTSALFEDYLTDAMTGSGKVNSMSLVPGRALFEELGKWSHALRGYLKLKERMDSDRNAMQANIDEIAQEWLTLGGAASWQEAVTFGMKGKGRRAKAAEANANMMDLMHRATISGVDPSRRFEATDAYETARGAETPASLSARDTHAKLRAEFLALPEGYQGMFRKVAKTYSDTSDAFDEAILQNLKSAAAISLKRAERAHRAAMQAIKDDGMTGPEAAIARDKADTALEKAKAESKAASGKRMMKLRQQFESNKVPGVYFPLARFGDYFTTARDSTGKVVSFSRFEKVADQKAEAERLRGMGYKVAQGVLSNSDDVKGAVDPRFIADVETLLEDAGANHDLRDAVWQRWLETMPDMSVRTNRIHRKGQRGFTNDALRAFTSNQFHAAHQLARLQYGLEMGERINEAEEEARRQKDPNRAMAVVNEARLRHEFTMKPTGAAWTTWATSTAFVWYLGATPAAAIVNLSQTTVMGPAILGAGIPSQGTRGAISALKKAFTDYVKAPGDPMKSKHLTDGEKAAITEAYERGAIDKTQAHDIAAIADSGVEYSGVRERAMRMVSWPFHQAEVANRTVTFLAAYRMAKADGQTDAAAIDKAASLTWKTHFDYQNTARPRFMQGDVAKVLTIFRQFSVNTIFRAARDLHQWQNGATKEERDEAKRQFVGITLSMMAHAGITGTWGYGIITTALAIMVPGADDEDLDRYLQNALLLEGDGIGAAAWNYTMGMALNGVPGHVTGTALSQRIGMPNLWFRDQNYDLEGAAWMERLMIEMLGPAASILIGGARGVQYVGEGNVVRGIEAAVPKVVRDIMRSGRYAVDGVTTRRGEELIDGVGVGDVIKTAMGFTPASVAERYEQNARMRGEEREIQRRRSRVLAKARESIIGDGSLSTGALDGIIEFNREFPEYPITNDTIRSSVRSKLRASAQGEFGLRINPRLNNRIRDAEAPLLYG